MLRRRLALCTFALLATTALVAGCGVDVKEDGGPDVTANGVDVDKTTPTAVEPDDESASSGSDGSNDDEASSSAEPNDEDSAPSTDEPAADEPSADDDTTSTSLPFEIPDFTDPEELAEFYENLGLSPEDAECLADAITTMDADSDPFTECDIDITDFGG